MNIKVIIGRLTRDAELTYTNNGVAILKGGIADSRKYKGKEETSFFDYVMFGEKAEKLNQYMLKGKQMALRGTDKQDRWEKEGQKHSKIVMIVDEVMFLDIKQATDNEKKQPFDEDIPFWA